MASAQKATDEQIAAAYAKHGSIWSAAGDLGMCGQSVHERLIKLGLQKPLNVFCDAEKAILLEQYQEAANAGKLSDLATAMGRTKPFICRQAKLLGITNAKRTRQYLSAVSSAAFKAWHQVNEHPRGMLHKRHSDTTCKLLSKVQAARWDSMTEDQRESLIIKQLRGRARANGGKLASPVSNRATSWKQAWREIGGQRCYFRSTWEANYARYLETLRLEGMILRWEHEPHTFWFEGIRRGAVSYLPDFRVTALDGSITFHEVKGWMDDRSKTKLARMGQRFPEVAMVVVDKGAYALIKSRFRYVIDGWEP